MPMIVEQIHGRFFSVWGNIGIAIQKKHRIICLFRHQLRKPVNLKFPGIELIEIAFINKGQNQIGQQKLSKKEQKGFIVN